MATVTNSGTFFDLALVESMNGGELVFTNGVLNTVTNKENQPYLAMFGGNADKSAWWGNNLFFKSQPNRQYSSLTEYTLNTTPLTSAGRRIIETAINSDLSFLKPSSVQVSILSDNVVSATVNGDFGQLIFNYQLRQTTNGDFYFLDFNDDFY